MVCEGAFVQLNGNDAERSVVYTAKGRSDELLSTDDARAMLDRHVKVFEALDDTIIILVV